MHVILHLQTSLLHPYVPEFPIHLVKVGFTESEISIPDGDSNHTVCVEVFDLTAEDIMPGQNLYFILSVLPSSTHTGMDHLIRSIYKAVIRHYCLSPVPGSIRLGLNQLTLNATDRVVCFEVAITCDTEVCEPGNFIIELMNGGNEDYIISFQERNMLTFSTNLGNLVDLFLGILITSNVFLNHMYSSTRSFRWRDCRNCDSSARSYSCDHNNCHSWISLCSERKNPW